MKILKLTILLLAIIFFGCANKETTENKDTIIEKNDAVPYNDNTDIKSNDNYDFILSTISNDIDISIIDTENFVAKINYLNGTWLSDKDFRNNNYQTKKEDFSWGQGVSAVYTSFDIDITSNKPFIHPPAIRPFSIINNIQLNNNSIMLHVNTSDEDDWHMEITFYFDNIDTIRIKSENFSITFYEENRAINPFDGIYLWHRLSGPEQ